MYSQHAGMSSQKPETFMLTTEAQQALPHDAQVALQQVDNLKYFLLSAPVDWQPDHYIRRFLLPTGEYVSCALWNNLFHISGTDIVRCLSFRFQAFGRPVKNSKKFEEGIFSDLRNLKSGTDASLEEPKSAFLDFLYKNNCIRTQKKQKVFYWYSVPHDRLFLDALERDLKRENMGQEVTTVAVSEPALSFQYDSSQSLYEQLTKAQQANSSSFAAQQSALTQSQPASPIMRAMDSMPPPTIIPQSMPPLVEGMDAMGPFGTMHGTPGPVPPMAQQVAAIKREPDYARAHYNQSLAMGATQQRHASLPAYALEYSPAPSIVSSHYEDYSHRGISFEPITPPHQGLGIPSEPAYVANDETGLYSAIPEHMPSMHGFAGMTPSNGNMSASQLPRSIGTNNVYSVIEGSPTYKQRRRRSSLTHSMSTNQGPIPVHTPRSQAHLQRPSVLRRSVSASAGLSLEGNESSNNSPSSMAYGSVGFVNPTQRREALDASRHGTPVSAVEGSPALSNMGYGQHEAVAGRTLDQGEHARMDQPRARSHAPGALRRARSATAMEVGPYPQKSHSCPIPTCGRLFKRLEHLKRHVRTHTQEKPYRCPRCNKAFSRSDNLAQHRRTHSREDGGEGEMLSGDEEAEFSGDEQLASLEEGSPTSEAPFDAGQGMLLHSSEQTSAQGFNNMQSLNMPMAIGQHSGML